MPVGRPSKTDPPIPNVIVFGESGGGKSSVINMLDGGPALPVDDSAEGSTSVVSPTACQKTISGLRCQVFDTGGLNKPGKTTWRRKDKTKLARRQLERIIEETKFNLFVYVMSAPQIPRTAQQNYRILYDLAGPKRVPIVVVITRLEDRDGTMDQWWTENKLAFDQRDLIFDGHACITAWKGKLKDGKYTNQDLYNVSKQKVEQLISNSCREASKMVLK